MAYEKGFIDGSLAHLGRDHVLIALKLTSHPVTISVPRSAFPIHLLRYGQPVRVTRNPEGWLEFRERPLLTVAPLPGEEEIDAWIDRL